MAAEFRPGEEGARQLDADDPLARWRGAFVLPVAASGEPATYLCGNSLGCQPRSARQEVETVLDEWGHLAVRGHHEASVPWYGYHEALTRQAAVLVGAEPREVVSMNSLTVNLHLTMISFYRPTAQRAVVLMEADSFPSDRYAVESQIRWHGLDPAEALVEISPRPGEWLIREEDLVEQIGRHGDRLALVLLAGVHYLTGQLFPLADVVREAHRVGALVGIDLAHAAGNVPLRLHDWDVDFAVWCSYKYLNGGPGAPGGCFVHARHENAADRPRLAGWWGTDPATRFQMETRFDPQKGAAGWQLSNPPILAMAALKASLDIFHQAGMEALRAKSVRLTGYLEWLLADSPAIAVVTPSQPEARGCQLSLRVRGGARELELDLAKEGFICDSREPDILRAAPVPLYNTFHDVWRFARVLGSRLSRS